MKGELQLDAWQLTDPGRERDHNEDYCGSFAPEEPELLAERGRLYLVADGIGGHQAGDVAAQYAVEQVLYAYYNDPWVGPGENLIQAICAASADLYQDALTNPARSGMGTTLVAAAVQGDELTVANVGDSRAYLVRGHKLRQLTQDHSLVAMMRKRNLLTEQEADDHPWKKVLTRVIGKHEDVKTDLFRISLRAGDRLLLCSDGLWGEADPLALAETLYRHLDPRVACKALVEDALQAGGRDNIGCVLWNAGLAKNPTGSGGLTRRLRFWRN